jgi:WD40 repeat protein
MSTNRPTLVVNDGASADWLALQERLADLALGHSAHPLAASEPTHARHLAFLPPEVLELDLSDPQQREFGDYELAEKLGQGGMGVVYRARQRSLDREVAVKLLAAGPWASRDFIERFRREAQSAARMQHPNIVSIFEVGAQDELNYFSMELVRGESLAGLLGREGPQSPRRAASLLRTVAEAVDYAHRLGVLHLDLKPGNVLIDERGEPKVADFGLARRLDDTLAADSDEVSGTPSYMAPEQATLKSRKLTPATDVYGLGAILYELLTGRPPFLAATPQETLKRVATARVERPRSLRADIPADLEAVCLKCLEKDPAIRYRSAQALVQDLAAFLDGRPVSVRPLAAPERLLRAARREPRMAAAIGAFVLALMAGLTATALQWRRADGHAAEARDRTWVLRAQAAQAALAEGDGFRGLRDLVANLGEMEAAGQGGQAAIERQRIGTLLANAPQLIDLVQVEQGLAIHALAISPDGAEFAVALHSPRGERSVRAFDVATGTPRWTTSTREWATGLPFQNMWHGWLRYTADGSRLLATLPDQSPFPYPRVADSMPLDARDGTLLRPPFAGDDLFDLVASDDGRIALVRWRADPSFRFPDSGQFHAIDGWRPIGPLHRFEAALQTDSWLPTPDGSAWLGTSGSSELRLHELGSLAVRWRITLPLDDAVRGWRFSRDGGQLALGTAKGRVLLVDPRDGSQHVLHGGPTAPVRWLGFSADGRTLAVRAEDATIAAWDTASRTPRITPIADAEGAFGAVHVDGDNLHSAIRGELRSYALPPFAGVNDTAVSEPVRIRNRRDIPPHAFGLHRPTNLLATAGTDGQVGLWRLPPPRLSPSRAAPLPTRTQHFDGHSLVAVEGSVVQLRDVFTDAPRSPVLRFPDPVRMAERSHDGRRLAVVAGRTLRVLDPVDGRLVGAPIVLPQVPLRAEIAPAAPLLVMTTGEYEGDLFRERLHVVDLEAGTLRDASVLLPGPIDLFRLEPAGRRLLVSAWNLRENSTQVLLHPLDGSAGCPQLVGEGINHVHEVAFAAGGRDAWLYGALPERRGALLRIDLQRCAETSRVPLQNAPVAPTVLAAGDDVIVHRQSGTQLTRLRPDGSRHDVPGLSRGRPLGVFALSADGRRAVVAARNAVQLIDLDRGEHLSGLLTAPIAGDDGITALMLSPDAGAVLARSFRGRWMAWRVPTDSRSVAELEQLAAVLDPRNADPPLQAAALEPLRRRLRAADLPPPPPAAAMPTIEFATAPGADPDPRFVPVDLRPVVNAPLNGGWPRRGTMGGDAPTLALGPQLLHHIDWRIDGGVQLSWGGAAAALHPTQRASAVVPVPMTTARRVHVLMTVHIPIDARQGRSRAATVVLLDRDGREHALEIQMLRDVSMRTTPALAEPGARIGWIGTSGADLRDGDATASDTTSFVYAVSLDVPPGTPAVHGLRLETRDGPMEAPLFYAVTLERDLAASAAATGPGGWP